MDRQRDTTLISLSRTNDLEPTLGAPALGPYERALSGIPCPDDTLHRSGNVPRLRRE
jgi:hypothetical protein